MAKGRALEARSSDKDRKGIGKGVSNRVIDAEVAKALAASEKERMAKAKLIAAEIQRKAILAAAKQDGGQSGSTGTPTNETPELLRNMCGILNRGSASPGSNMKSCPCGGTQMGALTDSVESILNDFWAGYEADEDSMSIDGSEAEPPPPAPFRVEHDLSDEEEMDNSQAATARDPPLEASLANLTQDNYFARLARALRAPSNVGEDLDIHLAKLVNHVFQHPLTPEEFVRQKEGL